MRVLMLAFFFFQAEDGIRAVAVTGVQTCALPILEQESFDGKNHLWLALEGDARETVPTLSGSIVTVRRPAGGPVRSEERRVGEGLGDAGIQSAIQGSIVPNRDEAVTSFVTGLMPI